MRRLGRGFAIPYEKASLDQKHEATPAHSPGHGLEEEIAWNVRELRLERTLLRCMTGLCPFVMEIATDCGFSCIFDDLEGELGYPMSADIGSLKFIWCFLDLTVKDKANEEVGEALHELVVFWAAQMTDALCFLQKCPIIHSDFRSENFVMGHDLYIRLIDFGMSFVDASQELLSSTFKPPRSLDVFNERLIDRYRRRLNFTFDFNHVQRKVRSAGIWEVTHAQKTERIDKDLLHLGKIYEIFNIG